MFWYIISFFSFHRTVGALNLRVEDGFLDPESNYTAFVEIVVPEAGNSGKNIIGRSPYMIPRKPGNYKEFCTFAKHNVRSAINQT